MNALIAEPPQRSNVHEHLRVVSRRFLVLGDPERGTFEAAHAIAIDIASLSPKSQHLCSMAYRALYTLQQVREEGLTSVSLEDVMAAVLEEHLRSDGWRKTLDSPNCSAVLALFAQYC